MAALGSVNYYLDGGTNMTGLRNTGNIAPNPDAVEEFRVVTNSYSAEYGRFAGRRDQHYHADRAPTSFTGRCSNSSATTI